MQYYDKLVSKLPESIRPIFPLIGVAYAAKLALQLLSIPLTFIYNSINYTSPKDLAKRYHAGSWVIVTGASDGIGKAFCEELTRDGFNIILISRSISKLEAAVADLKKIRESVMTKIIVADFVRSYEPGFFERIQNELVDFEVSMLVNCVGLETMDNFENINEDFMRDMIIVNTLPLVFLSRILIEKSKERSNKHKYRSAIINIASISGLRHMPYFCPYSPTKAFTDYFSLGLAKELEDSNIDILSLRPGYVHTRMTVKKPLGIDTITANVCARNALSFLGKTNATSAHWKHRFVAWQINLTPDWMYNLIAGKIVGKEMKRRKDGLALLGGH